MARKTLLTEAEIRQFMKLANIEPLQEMGGELPVPGMRDDEDEDEPGMRDPMQEGEHEDEDEPGARDYMQEGEDEEEEPGMRDEMMEQEDEEAPAPEMPAPEGGEEMEMDMEMPAPADDMDDMGGMDAGGGKEEQLADIVEKLGELLGLEVDAEVQPAGAEEMPMGGDAMDDEGGDLEGPMDAPEAPEMEMGDDDDADEPMMESDDDIVQEVARRVAARLLREKKEEDIANKLAERIFRRLASK